MEISPFSLRYRRQHGGRWQRQLAAALAELPGWAARHLAIRRLAAQVALPFEVRGGPGLGPAAPKTPWRPLDLGAPSRRHLPRYGPGTPELRRTVKALLAAGPDGSLEEFVAGQFRRARARLCRRAPRAGFLWPGAPEARRRERLLARRLARPGGPAPPRWCTWAAGSTWWPGRILPACGVIWRISSAGECCWTRRTGCRTFKCY